MYATAFRAGSLTPSATIVAIGPIHTIAGPTLWLIAPRFDPTTHVPHEPRLRFLVLHGKEQVAVLELGKDVVRTTLAIVETRSQKTLEYQDDEARKASRG